MSRRAIDNADKRIKTFEVDLSRWQVLVEAEKRRVAEVRRQTFCHFTLTDATSAGLCFCERTRCLHA